MLIEFRFKNYRSFRDEATLSMEATGLGPFKRPVCAGRFHRADDAHCRYHAGIQRRG